MMTSTVKEKPRSVIDFPKLMINRQSKAIVLMYRVKEGIVVKEGGINHLGMYISDWIMSAFEDFHGEIILKQE